MSYLHLCINEDNDKCIEILVNKGIDTSTPNCTAFPPPIHYAIKLKKNKALTALLEARADPNLQASTGNTPLITAVNSENCDAVQILLEYDADPNIQNKKGEIPLFHAIHKGDTKSVSLLLDYQSNMTVGKKSGIHYCIKQNQAECCRIMLEHNADKNERDQSNRTPLDIAYDLEDPTIELLLYCPEVPSSATSYGFVKYLNKIFEVNEVEEVRDIMSESPNRIPQNIHQFIERIITAERCHVRFSNYLKQRVVKIDNTIEELSHPSKEFLDKDIEKLSKQLRNSFIKRIDDSTRHQRALSDTLYSPTALLRYAEWGNWTRDFQGFIDDIINRGLLAHGMKDDCVKNLEDSKKERVKIIKLSEQVSEKTGVFQKEIADFITATIKKLKELEVEGIPNIEKHFKVLLRQIEETNPELINAQFKKNK